jgi:hypothetical protein
MNIDVPSNLGAHGRLWLAVIQQAITDYENEGTKPGDALLRSRAHHWFHSDRDDVGSFRWICSLFGLSQDKAFKHISDGRKRPFKNAA